MTEIILPELGEGITEAQVVRWNFKAGERVTLEDDVVELVTDKAVFNVPAPSAGVIGRIFYREGQTAPVGAVLAEMKGQGPRS